MTREPASRHPGANRLVIAAVLGLFLLALLIRLYLATWPGYEDDTTHFKWWTILVTEQGLSQGYSGTYPMTHAIYPPLMLFFLKIVGHVYQILVSPTFVLEAPQFGFMIKGLGIIFDIFIWAAIFIWVRKWSGLKAATVVSLAYALNPAIIFDVAYWGQPDPLHTFFLFLAVLFLVDRRMALGWACLAASAFVKPQAWILVPLAGVLTVWRGGLPGLAQGAAGAAAVSLALIAPYLLNGTLEQLLALPGDIYGAMQVLSANAHNIWQLYNPDPVRVPDSGRIWLVSERTASQILFGAAYLFALWRLLKGRAGGPAIAGVAAFLAFSFFMLLTRVHENHMFMAFPLLAVAMAEDSRLRWVFGVLTATLLANLALHDPTIAAALWSKAPQPYWLTLRVANSAANLLALVGWIVILVVPRREIRGPNEEDGESVAVRSRRHEAGNVA